MLSFKYLTCVFILIACLCFSSTLARANPSCQINQQSPKVAFIVPTSGKHEFFDRLVELTQAASKQLNIQLRLHLYDEPQYNRFYYAQYIDNVLKAENDNDYLISLFYSQTEKKVMDIVEKHNIRFFSFNSPLSNNVIKLLGKPREKTANWIGHLSPNDEQAGYDLAKHLIDKSEQKAISMLAINGSRNSEVGKMRAQGLVRKVSENNEITLLQLLHTDWTYQQARDKTALILQRYQDIDVIWSASDSLARGVIDEIEHTNPTLLNNIITGSIDWSPQVVPYLKNNKVTASYGGHIFEGAWLMALIYDHFNGLDFQNELGAVIHDNLLPITKENAELIIKTDNDNINFKQLSKCLTPSTTKYNFNPLALLINEISDE